MQAVELDFETKQERSIPVSQARASCDAGRFCWIDADELDDRAGAQAMLQQMGVNEHAIEQVLGPDVDGRYDLYDDCLHIAVTAAVYQQGQLKGSHVDIVIGERFLVTVRRGPVEFIDQVRRVYRSDFLRFARTGGFLLYEYWDHLIDGFRRTIRTLDASVERVQGEILGAADDRIFTEAGGVMRDMLSLRKIMLAGREVLHELTARRSSFVPESTVPTLERLAGALERLVADLTVERESLAETLNLYMGIVSHRTNRIVSRLTVISMVFLPLTFVVGVYGMNFGGMPGTDWSHGFALICAAMLLTAAGLLLFMKWRKWW